jgi:hypothetical protein
VNDHTFNTVFSAGAAGSAGASVAAGSAGEAGSAGAGAGASVAAPPQAAKSILVTTSKLKSNKTDLRMFLLLQCFFNWLYYLYGANLRTRLQIFLLSGQTKKEGLLFRSIRIIHHLLSSWVFSDNDAGW